MNMIQRGFVRTSCFCQDRPILAKWWLPGNPDPGAKLLQLPYDPQLLSKADDPRWRVDRPVVLLKRPYRSVLTRVVTLQGGSWSITAFAVAAEYFTMRVDNKPLSVSLVDWHFNSSLPELVQPGTHSSPVLSPELMGMYITCRGLDCTHI